MLVIVGPTGAGKSALAVAIAAKAGAEIISADSQQVYRGMDIGTGKVSQEDMRGVPHHLLSVLEPDEEMTAADFASCADACISKHPGPWVVVGGTMLYVQALLYGVFDGPPKDEAIRTRLAAIVDVRGAAYLYDKLAEVDPDIAAKIAPTDSRRIIRALEVHELTGIPMSVHQAKHDFSKLPAKYPYLQIALAPPRAQLYPQINARVTSMWEAGLPHEVAALRTRGLHPDHHRSQQAIGYRETHDHLDGKIDDQRCIELIQRNSRRYARRQVSWYRGDGRTRWFESTNQIDLHALERYLKSEHEIRPGTIGSGDPRF